MKHDISWDSLTSLQQIGLLHQQGLSIKHISNAENAINEIGFENLSIYMPNFRVKGDPSLFKHGSCLDKIISMHYFDIRLQALILKQLQHIESYCWQKTEELFVKMHGTQWLNNKDLFINQHLHQLEYTGEFPNKGNTSYDLATIGTIYEGMGNTKKRQQIARTFKLAPRVLGSWLILLGQLKKENVSNLPLLDIRLQSNKDIFPRNPSSLFQGKIPLEFYESLYGLTAIINRILQSIDPQNTFINEFLLLIRKYRITTTEVMGFPANWKEIAAWDSLNKDSKEVRHARIWV